MTNPRYRHPTPSVGSSVRVLSGSSICLRTLLIHSRNMHSLQNPQHDAVTAIRESFVSHHEPPTLPLRPWEGLGRFFCNWRCQDREEGPNDRGNVVEGSLDGFYALGTLRF
jgi:hypothetical protein